MFSADPWRCTASLAVILHPLGRSITSISCVISLHQDRWLNQTTWCVKTAISHLWTPTSATALTCMSVTNAGTDIVRLACLWQMQVLPLLDHYSEWFPDIYFAVWSIAVAFCLSLGLEQYCGCGMLPFNKKYPIVLSQDQGQTGHKSR